SQGFLLRVKLRRTRRMAGQFLKIYHNRKMILRRNLGDFLFLRNLKICSRKDTINNMEKIKNFYQTSSGKIPFDEWLEKLDFHDSNKVLVRVSRLVLGNTSNCEPVGDGVHEIKVDFGPGYRVYFANISDNEVLILYGGTKKGQQKDINKAINYFKDYKIRGKYGKK
ncbi:hypothetical protein M1466_01245, partial [Candidatus Dependentiae bacterium]|nr:hypothetical protein [Candidatus Dependentiae bacterium]